MSMAELSIPEYRVPVDRLCPGVYIRLEHLAWFEHPFLFNSFKIKDEQQIEVLKRLDLGEVVCVPEKSDRAPLEPEEAAGIAPAPAPSEQSVEDLWRVKRERARLLAEKKRRIAECEARYASAVQDVTELMRLVLAGKPQAVPQAIRLIEGLTPSFLADRESTLHLMTLQGQAERLYFHALNVAVLSLMVGHEVGLTERELLYLGAGALFHDVGKVQIEKRILKKPGALTRAEQAMIQRHPELGRDMVAPIREFPRPALEVIVQHHERMDGTGYPRGLAGEAIDRLARITAIADAYDNHCNRPDPADSYTPYQALSHMFSREQSRFDRELLSLFIRCLGVYPPGTVIQLSNGAIGMVVSVNPQYQLYPSVVVYDPEIPKKEALVIDLSEERELTIDKSIRPAQLPRDIYDYLNPRTRISYFVEPDAPRRPER
jgi:putative nucleotidyltransferase with HDIG domain